MSREYPTDWNSRRKEVYKRDDYTCQNCGRKGGINGDAELHAHHVVPKSKDGRHQLNNLLTVCSECHKAIHGDSMAPTANRQYSQSTHRSSSQSQGKDTRSHFIDASFERCPLCSSEKIGTDGEQKNVTACPDCEVKFELRNKGFAIIDMDYKRLAADTAFNYSRKMMGHTLRSSLWQKVGSAEDISQLDFEYLEEKSKKEAIHEIKITYLFILFAIGTYILIYVITGSIQTTALYGFIFTVPTAIYIAKKNNQTNIEL